MSRILYIAGCCLLLLGTPFSTAAAQYATSTFTIAPYAEARRFSWEERVGEKRLLQEIGTRYSFGAVSRFWFVHDEIFFCELEAAYTTGKAEYDGARLDDNGEYISYSATTAYSGFEGELLLGSTLKPSANFFITPVAGAGLEYWLRNLDSEGPYGYTEKYSVPSLDGGIRLTYLIDNSLQVFSSFLIRYPLSISESFTLALAGQNPIQVTLHPGAMPQYRARFGLDIYRVLLIFSYESWKWDISDVSHQYYQPASSRKEYGVRIGYSLGF